MVRFDRPRAAGAVIAIAMVLSLPSLFSPLFIDEYVQAARWKAGLGSFLNNCFVFGTPAINRWEMEHTHGVWWTAPDFKVAFWRPISAVTHAIDLSLWPGNSVLMHLHTLLWFLLLLLALRALYRRFLEPAVASVALALYAWDDARGMLLSWIANRAALLAALFGVCALLAYDKRRRDGWRAGAWLAPVAFAVGLLCSEMAVATTAFLFGYALCVDKGPIARRLGRLAPFALVGVAWQAFYFAFGYGTQASGGYTHPLLEPVAYGTNLLQRAPVLSLGQLTPIPSDAFGMFPPAGKLMVILLAVATLGIVARVSWPRLAPDPRARFLLIGAGLSLLLISATGPQDRNLVFVGVGVAPALAVVVASMVRDPSRSRWPGFVVGALAVFNLVLAPLQLPLKSVMMLAAEQMMAPVDRSIPRNADVTGRTLVVPWMAFEPAVYFSWYKRDFEGAPKPGRTRILAASFGDVSVTRLDDVTLRVRPEDGFLASEASRMYRGPSRPFHPGDEVALSNMTARVTEVTDGGRPQTVEFRFSAPLESPEWLWMRGSGGGLVDWSPPKVGETVVVPAEG